MNGVNEPVLYFQYAHVTAWIVMLATVNAVAARQRRPAR